MDYASIILNAAITGITAVIAGLLCFKIAYKSAKKDLFKTIFDKDTLHNGLQMLVNDEKLQRFCFEIGGMFAAGAGTGLGLGGGSGKPGKIDLKTIGLQLLANYLSGKVAIPAQNPNSTPQQALNSNTNKVGY